MSRWFRRSSVQRHGSGAESPPPPSQPRTDSPCEPSSSQSQHRSSHSRSHSSSSLFPSSRQDFRDIRDKALSRRTNPPNNPPRERGSPQLSEGLPQSPSLSSRISTDDGPAAHGTPPTWSSRLRCSSARLLSLRPKSGSETQRRSITPTPDMISRFHEEDAVAERNDHPFLVGHVSRSSTMSRHTGPRPPPRRMSSQTCGVDLETASLSSPPPVHSPMSAKFVTSAPHSAPPEKSEFSNSERPRRIPRSWSGHPRPPPIPASMRDVASAQELTGTLDRSGNTQYSEWAVRYPREERDLWYQSDIGDQSDTEAAEPSDARRWSYRSARQDMMTLFTVAEAAPRRPPADHPFNPQRQRRGTFGDDNHSGRVI